MPDARVEDAIRTRLRAEANVVRVPETLVGRIMRDVREEASRRSVDRRIEQRLQDDAERVDAPRDMPSRVRNAIQEREARRVRFRPAALAGPAIIVACVIGVIGLVSIVPWADEDGGQPSSGETTAKSDSDSSPPGGGRQALANSLPGGAVVPDFVPAGYELVHYEQPANSVAPLSYRLEDGEGGYVQVFAESVPPSESFGPPADSLGPQLYEDRDRSYTDAISASDLSRRAGEATLTFYVDQERITITANELSDEELLRLALSMIVAP